MDLFCNKKAIANEKKEEERIRIRILMEKVRIREDAELRRIKIEEPLDTVKMEEYIQRTILRITNCKKREYICNYFKNMTLLEKYNPYRIVEVKAIESLIMDTVSKSEESNVNRFFVELSYAHANSTNEIQICRSVKELSDAVIDILYTSCKSITDGVNQTSISQVNL
jgi:hypothetical protein